MAPGRRRLRTLIARSSRAAIADTESVGGLFCPLVLGDRAERFWPVAAVWLPMAAVMTVMARAYATYKHAPAESRS